MDSPGNSSDTSFWHDPFWVGKLLRDSGRISEEQLASAIASFRNNPAAGFAATLETLGLITAQGYSRILAEKANLPFVSQLDPVREIARTVSKARALQRLFLPTKQTGPVLTIAVADPVAYTTDDARIDFNKPNLRFAFVVAPRKDIQTAIESVWTETAAITNTDDYLSQLIFRAIERRASDIHFEPKAHSLNVRFRIDGSLTHDSYIPPTHSRAVVQAIKLAANLNISERRIPQDGQFSRAKGSNSYSFRVSSLPTTHGEKVVIRISDDNANLRPFAELGMSAEQIRHFGDMINMPTGMIVVTGPTGSGKTTLLYSAVDSIDSHGLNVSTVEDPVEYNLSAINQTQVNPDIGLTFASCLRSLLRQDPDVIVVGEIRDQETARIATQAALTGHLVMTTLHTNDAASAVTRLIDMGVDPFLVSSTVKGVLAQRLIRRVCSKCSAPHPHNAALCERFRMPAGTTFMQGKGCPECRNTGYHGRIGVFEVFPLHIRGDADEIRTKNNTIERIINGMGLRSNPTTENDLLSELLSRGHTTLRSDGIAKAAAGITTIEEVMAHL